MRPPLSALLSRDRSGPAVAAAGRPSRPVPDAGREQPTVRLAVDRCMGCQECVRVCRLGAIRPVPDGSGTVRADSSLCSGCRLCVPVCPFRVITVTGPARNRHQILLDRLHGRLAQEQLPGWDVTVGQPLPTGASDGPALTPDLAVLRRDAADRGTDGPRIDLVVEVVTSTTCSRTLGPRLAVYRQLGVGTCWTLNQRSGVVTVQWRQHPNWFDRVADRTFS